MKKHCTLLILLIAVSFITSGCYTVLRHSDDEDGYTDYDSNYNDTYGYSHYYYPDYWTLTPRWGHYYGVPWWWEHNWYHNTGTVIYYDDDDSPRSSGGQKAVRPRSRFEEAGPLGVPNISRGTTGTSSSSSSSTNTSAKQKPEIKKSETKVKEVKTKESSKTKKEAKPTRRTGRWHK